jgi:hypothetical protein
MLSRKLLRFILRVAAIAGMWCAAGKDAPAEPTPNSPPATAEGIAFFESKVRPLLLERCGKCHTAKEAAEAGDLVLDSPAGILVGGSRGAAFVAGKPDESLLLKAVRYADTDLQMPPEGKLPPAASEVLARWIEMGAPLPASGASAPSVHPSIDIAAGRKFWSFQPLAQHPLPPVTRTSWPQRPMDAFVLSRLEREGLAPSDPAERRMLIRRATLDLIGLPPTPVDVDAFIADTAPDAYERVVDRLLASPHYGERWGRYWLDLARYADENPSWLSSAKLGYRYRDWVVAALNADLPYDQFVKLQLAADLLPESKPADLAALGFLGLSPTYWKELRLAPPLIELIVADEWDEKIDAVSRTVLGLTVACARCHDHKFDPISTRDYYALAGIFASTQQVDRPQLEASAAEVVRAAAERIKKIEAEITALKDKDADKTAQFKEEIERIKRETPHFSGPWVHAVEDSRVDVLPDGPDMTRVVYHRGEAIDLPVFKRGNPSNRGDIVARRFLKVLSPAEGTPLVQGSGRRDLADALFKNSQPLAARVIVNRVWAHHFGIGLVRTPSDFGQQGERPSHPDLLDALAARLVAGGWSLKKLHRELVLSATYQQTSGAERQTEIGADPGNRQLWRMNRRRLDVEAWRDSLLAASGRLDLQVGGPSIDLSSSENRRRTLYARIGREDQDNLLLLYDFPTPTGHSPSREQTTTPLQQLFVLNSPLFSFQAAALAEQIGPPSSSELIVPQVRQLYRELLARAPTERETELAQAFLAATELGAPSASWSQYVHAVLGSNEVMFVD